MRRPRRAPALPVVDLHGETAESVPGAVDLALNRAFVRCEPEVAFAVGRGRVLVRLVPELLGAHPLVERVGAAAAPRDQVLDGHVPREVEVPAAVPAGAAVAHDEERQEGEVAVAVAGHGRVIVVGVDSGPQSRDDCGWRESPVPALHSATAPRAK